jgi:hypothetical protein
MLLIIDSDEVDGKTQVAKTSRPSNSVQVGLSILGEVKVNDYIDRQDVDTSCEDICAHQASRLSILEIVVNSTKIVNTRDLTYLFLSACCIFEWM